MTSVDYDDIYEEFLLLTSSSSSSSSSSVPSPSQVVSSTRQRRNCPTLTRPQQEQSEGSDVVMDEGPIFPGGLEVLWREVPIEFQRIISPYDVPDTARFRGYFTVQELLILKRTLSQRYNALKGSGGPLLPPLRRNQQSSTAVAAARAATQASNIMNANSGVGGVVKEAVDTLDEPQQQQQSTSNTNDNNSQVVPTSSSESSNYDGSNQNESCSQYMQSQKTVSGGMGPPTTTTVIKQQQQQQQPYLSCQVKDGGEHISITPDIKHIVDSSTLPPPYRTATLVFKLLQIGNYQLRSFSDVNPNRLRVLFNTQRLSYECQLPVIPFTAPGSMQPLRKILTIEVGFEQISVMKFGPDKLQLRVDGPPCLTVTYGPSNEEPRHLQLSQQDQYLLDQIDKGQLKLSPHHQLFFLNERLVNLLESQFREHPRFSYLLAESQSYR